MDGPSLFRVFQQLPDLMNGDETTFHSIFVTAGLSTEYHWIDKKNLLEMTADPTPDEYKASVVREAAIHMVLMSKSAAIGTKASLFAVMLAVSRATIRRCWGIADNDIISTQLYSEDLKIGTNGKMASDVATFGTVKDFEDATTAVTTIYDAHANDLLSKVAQCAIPMPACNGYVLVNTQTHHYVPTHRVACDIVVKQIFQQDMPDSSLVDSSELHDLICHKAAHPISSAVLVWLARSPEVKARIMLVGHGGAAARLPAKFAPERAAGAIEALIVRAKLAAAPSNVAVDTSEVEQLVKSVEAKFATNPTARSLVDAHDEVEKFKSKHGPTIAFLAGFLKGQLETASIATKDQTMLNAQSVMHVCKDNGASFAEGLDHYALASKWRKTKAKEGYLAGYGFFGANAPDDLTPADEAAKN